MPQIYGKDREIIFRPSGVYWEWISRETPRDQRSEIVYIVIIYEKGQSRWSWN